MEASLLALLHPKTATTANQDKRLPATNEHQQDSNTVALKGFFTEVLKELRQINEQLQVATQAVL